MIGLSSQSTLTIDNSLARLGFRYNPFEFLESSADPHLPDYLIGNEVFSMASEDQPACVLAAPGSGKTSARIAISRSFWAGHGGRPTFPIVYNLPEYIELLQPAQNQISYSIHLENLLKAGSASLLVNLAFRPEQFLSLPAPDQQYIACLLHTYLPLPPEYYLSILEQTGDPNKLRPVLERTYPAREVPPESLLIAFCAALSGCQAETLPVHPEEQFERFNQFLRGPMGARNIFILLDSVDAFPPAPDMLEQYQFSIGSLLEKSADLATRQIYLKCFLPDDALPLLKKEQVICITWNSDQLVDLVRKRIHAATEGHIASMDAMASTGLIGVDQWIVNAVPPRPREVILLCRRILLNFAQGISTGQNNLRYEDVEGGIQWYREFCGLNSRQDNAIKPT